MKRGFTVLSLAALLVGGVASAPGHRNLRSYIVVADSLRPAAGIADALRSVGATQTREIAGIGVLVATSDRADFAEAAARVEGVQGVAPDTRSLRLAGGDAMHGVAMVGPAVDMDAEPTGDGTTEPYFGPYQWNMRAIHAPEAWAQGALGEGVRVAVVDTGIFKLQKDFAAGQINVTLSRSFVPGEDWNVLPTAPYLSTPRWHGTHVAGIIAAAQNGIGTSGVAPKAEIVAIKVLRNADGYGTWSQVIDGIVYAADVDADVINLSLGGSYDRRGSMDDNGTADPSDDVWFSASEVAAQVNAMQRAVDYAVKHGALVVAAAGNDAIDEDHAKDRVELPAGLAKVLCVSATGPIGYYADRNTNLDLLASYSNYGQSEIDLAAPGGDFQTYPAPTYSWDMVVGPIPGGFAWAAGTSMAAPHVSGVAALIIGKHGGSMDPADVASILRKTAADLGKPGRDDAFGHGRVDAGAAVR